MLKTVLNKLREFDVGLGEHIHHFLEKYNIPNPAPFFSRYLPFFIKVDFYLILLLIPFAFLKLLNPINHRKRTLIIIAIVIALGLSTFSILLGFFQLAWIF